jgi:hypothetical protein
MHQHEVRDCERWLLSLYSQLLQPPQDDPQGQLLLHLSNAVAALQLLHLPPDQRDISEDSIKKLRRHRRVSPHGLMSITFQYLIASQLLPPVLACDTPHFTVSDHR